MKSFFNAADDAILHELDEDKFETSLLYNILFQDELVLNENYFYNSFFLQNHYLNYSPGQKSTLFMEACKSGIIIPAFRKKGVYSLVEAYDYVKKKAYERNPEIIPHNFEIIENSLREFDKHINKDAVIHWPDHNKDGKYETLGQSYQKLVSTLVALDNMPDSWKDEEDDDARFNRKFIWDRSKKWRLGVFEKLSRKYENSDVGLTRSDFFTEIASDLGIKNPNRAVRFGDIENEIKDPNDYLALKTLYRWLNHCHHINSSQRLGTNINLLMYNTKMDYVADNYFLDKQISNANNLIIPIELCSMETLRKVKVQELIEVRNEQGNAYRSSLKNYSLNQSPENKSRIVSTLQDYTSAICELTNTALVEESKAIINLDDLVSIGAASAGVLGACYTDYSIESAMLSGAPGAIYPILKRALKRIKSKRKESIDLELSFSM